MQQSESFGPNLQFITVNQLTQENTLQQSMQLETISHDDEVFQTSEQVIASVFQIPDTPGK